MSACLGEKGEMCMWCRKHMCRPYADMYTYVLISVKRKRVIYIYIYICLTKSELIFSNLNII